MKATKGCALVLFFQAILGICLSIILLIVVFLLLEGDSDAVAAMIIVPTFFCFVLGAPVGFYLILRWVTSSEETDNIEEDEEE